MQHILIDRWGRWVVEKRWIVILLTLLAFGALMMPMKNLYFDNSNEMWFLDDDPALKHYEEFRDRFGNGQYLLVGLEAPDGEETVFNEQTLRVITKLTRLLEDHEYVDKVTSLANYQFIHSEDDTLNTEDLIEDPEERFGVSGVQLVKRTDEAATADADADFDDDAGFDETGFGDEGDDEQEVTTAPKKVRSYADMAKIMRGEFLAQDFLISKDLRHTIVSARVIHKQGMIDHHVKLVKDLNAFIAQEKFVEQGVKLRITGNPLISERFLTYSMQDQGTTMPAMFALILLFLFISFRTLAGVTMPLVVIFGSVITVVGTLGAFGWAFNMLNAALPVLLMAVGIGDSIHIIVEFYHFRNEGYEPKEAAAKAASTLWVPCFNTSLTTAIGFLAISTSNLVPLKEYGVIAAVGVFVAFLISVTTLPALLSFVKGKPEKTKKLVEHGFTARVTAGLMPFTFKYSKPIVAVGVLIAGFSIYFSSQITVDANFVNYFKEDTKVRQDILYFDDVYNGFANLEFVLDSGEEGGVKNPKYLKQALAFQEYLETIPAAGKANSVLNYIRKMNQAMHDDDPNFYILPDSRELTAQYLLLYENSSPEEDLTDLKSMDERVMRISLKLQNMSTAKMKVLVEEIKLELENTYPELNTVITGDLILFNSMDIYIQEGLVRSFSLAIGLIVICFFVLLRSFKYGLLAMIPSLFPIFFAGGIMYLMGLTLDLATMIVAAVTFGIAVDDTIHVMNRYILGRNNGKTRKESVHLAMTESGRALVFTSVILYFGFSSLMLSSLMPNIYFGFFAGIIIMTALAADLLLLPAVMFLTGDKEAYPIKKQTKNAA